MAGRRTHQVVALGSWAVAVAVLTGISAAADLVPDELAQAPRVGGGIWLVGMVLVTAQALALGLTGRRRAVAALATATAAPVGGLVGLGPAIGCTSVAVIVAVFLLCADGIGRRTTLALAAAAALVAAGELFVRVHAGDAVLQSVGSSLLQGLGTVGAPALVGAVVATRRETRAARTASVRAEAGERAALVEAAVARERTAMARELHDIAAHHLTGIAVMSAAIGQQIDRDPEGAKQAVRLVREQSTSMLRDMRGLVGLLRTDAGATRDGEEAGQVVQESLDGIAALVDAAVVRGEPVELVVGAAEGRDPGEHVGPLVQLSAYRTVQEALTNAARHAPGRPCRVEVDRRSPSEVRITVTNDLPRTRAGAPSRGGGFGLVGMRERAELTGCRLTCGPVDDTWVVSLVLPVRHDPQLIEEAP